MVEKTKVGNMQYSQEIINAIKEVYVSSPYPTISKIAKLKKMQPKTIYRWRDAESWDRILAEKAKTMYIEQRMSTKDIMRIMHRQQKVVDAWRKSGKWDIDKFIVGGIGLSREMVKQFNETVEEALKDNTFTTPGVADKLTKLLMIIKKVSPQRVQLSNIFEFLKDLTDFVSTLGDKQFSKLFQKYLIEMSDYLRNKYAGE